MEASPQRIAYFWPFFCCAGYYAFNSLLMLGVPSATIPLPDVVPRGRSTMNYLWPSDLGGDTPSPMLCSWVQQLAYMNKWKPGPGPLMSQIQGKWGWVTSLSLTGLGLLGQNTSLNKPYIWVVMEYLPSHYENSTLTSIWIFLCVGEEATKSYPKCQTWNIIIFVCRKENWNLLRLRDFSRTMQQVG